MSKFIDLIVLACLATGCKHPAPKALVREVTFKGYNGMELQGTLQLPEGPVKAPAILLLPGSGPTDRDGNQAGLKIDILKQIAEKLAADGIASYRFDKRAVPSKYGTSYPKDLPKLDDFFSWEAFAEDAAQAYAILRSQPEIDTARVGVLGHSEGGLSAAAISEKAKPKALILVSTPGRNLGDVIEEQISQGYSAKLTEPAALKKRVAETKRIVKAIRDNHKVPADVPAELAPLFPSYLARYLTSVITLEPTSFIKQYSGPVLIVQGDTDIQVSKDRDAPALEAGFLQTKPELFIVKNASHCLKKVAGEADPGFEGPVIPEALEKVASWAKAAL